jgi:hypothetical protein
MKTSKLPQILRSPVALAALISVSLFGTVQADNDDWGENAVSDSVPGIVFNSIRDKIVFSPELLASSAYLWTERDSKGFVFPGNGVVDPCERAAYQPFDKIRIAPVGKANYKLGDTLDVIKSIRLMSLKGKTANLVRRSGRAVVEGNDGKKIVATLIKVWDVIEGGERVAPAESFEVVRVDSLVAPEKNIQAKVITRVEQTVAPYLHQMFIIDKGATDGVLKGDCFTVFENSGKDSFRTEVLLGYVIHVSPGSSTLVIVKLFQSKLEEGFQAFLSRRVQQP